MTTPSSELPSVLPGKASYVASGLKIRKAAYELQGKIVVMNKDGKDGKVFEKDGKTPATKCVKHPQCELAHDRKLTKRGAMFFVVALACMVGAWYASGFRKVPHRPSEETSAA